MYVHGLWFVPPNVKLWCVVYCSWMSRYWNLSPTECFFHASILFYFSLQVLWSRYRVVSSESETFEPRDRDLWETRPIKSETSITASFHSFSVFVLRVHSIKFCIHIQSCIIISFNCSYPSRMISASTMCSTVYHASSMRDYGLACTNTAPLRF